jgi:hypothetical protein
MSTIHMQATTTSTPEQFLAALIDFGQGRSKIFGNSADEYLIRTFRSVRGGTDCSRVAMPVHLVNHLATMADLHRAGRYDRISDDVLTLSGQRPLSVQEVVRKNAATFTASAKSA